MRIAVFKLASFLIFIYLDLYYVYGFATFIFRYVAGVRHSYLIFRP